MLTFDCNLNGKCEAMFAPVLEKRITNSIVLSWLTFSIHRTDTVRDVKKKKKRKVKLKQMKDEGIILILVDAKSSESIQNHWEHFGFGIDINVENVSFHKFVRLC